MPVYNAEATLSRTLAEIDREVIDELVLVDDASTDRTVLLARETYPGMPWEPKESFRAVADFYATHTAPAA